MTARSPTGPCLNLVPMVPNAGADGQDLQLFRDQARGIEVYVLRQDGGGLVYEWYADKLPGLAFKSSDELLDALRPKGVVSLTVNKSG
jgi:hypothetical protein